MKRKTKIGSLVRGSNSGLGNMAWEFARQGLIDKTLIVKRRMEVVFPDRFINVRECWQDSISNEDTDWILDGIDTLLIFENEYQRGLTYKAHKRGIKVVVMPMHEGTPWKEMYADIWLCPSSLEYDCNYAMGEKIRINVPVNTDMVIWKLREKAIDFVHNTGRGGANLRNGTVELLASLDKSKQPFNLKIRSQLLPFAKDDKRLTIDFKNIQNYWDLWIGGDVFIFPEKFNGLSLPVQEAFASGYAVMVADRKPFNEWLPKELLIPIEGEEDATMENTFKSAIISPDKIAEYMDKWYNQDISKFSLMGKKWGEENSWYKLKSEYERILQ
jgi:hypothetical protein